MLNDERGDSDDDAPDEVTNNADGATGDSVIGDATDGSGYDTAGAALGVLSPEEAAAVLAAAENDPMVARELAELQAVVAELSRTGPVVSINRGRSAGIRSRLVARVAASHAGRPVTRQSGPIASITPARAGNDVETVVAAPAPPSGRAERRGTTRLSSDRRGTAGSPPPSGERRGRFWKRTLGVLAVAAVLLTAAGVFQLWRDRDVRGTTTAAAAVAVSSIATHDTLFQTVLTLRDQLARRDSMIAALRNPRTRVVDLASFAPPSPPGRAFWDQTHQHLMVTLMNLKPPAPGRTYQLWVIARGHSEPMSAGTFAPDSTGRAEMTTQLPVEPGRLRRVVVTDEPMGGSQLPTGPVLFAGR